MDRYKLDFKRGETILNEILANHIMYIDNEGTPLDNWYMSINNLEKWHIYKRKRDNLYTKIAIKIANYTPVDMLDLIINITPLILSVPTTNDGYYPYVIKKAIVISMLRGNIPLTTIEFPTIPNILNRDYIYIFPLDFSINKINEIRDINYIYSFFLDRVERDPTNNINLDIYNLMFRNNLPNLLIGQYDKYKQSKSAKFLAFGKK